MLVLKFTVLTILLIQGALGRNFQRRNIRHILENHEYKSSVNHPPEPDAYQGIPVSVVYEDEIKRKDKSIKSDISTANDFEEVNKEPVKAEHKMIKEAIHTNSSNDNNVTVKPRKEISEMSNPDEQISNKTKLTPAASISKQDQQIPVAVIYEPESDYINTRPNNNRVSTQRRKVHRPSVEEKQVAATNDPDASVKEQEYTQENSTSNTQKQTNSTSENSQLQNSRKYSPVDEKQKVQTEPTRTTVIETENKQEISVADKQQFISRQNSTRQSGKEKLVAEKETKQSGNSHIHIFPKRDNSTKERDFVPIIQSENLVFSHSGDFQYSYEGGDGTKAFEKGQLKTYEDENTGEAVSGGFSYTADDGKEYSLSYTADENGYRPVGAHLPTPPPIPPAIARALAYLATKTTSEPLTVTESLTESDS